VTLNDPEGPFCVKFYFCALEVFLKRYAIYKSTLYLLLTLLSYLLCAGMFRAVMSGFRSLSTLIEANAVDQLPKKQLWHNALRGFFTTA